MARARHRLRFAAAALGVFALLVAAGVLLPSPIRSRAFVPAPASAPKLEELACEVHGADRIAGPEELEVDAQGRVYAGTRDGTVVRLTLREGGAEVEVFARPGGHPQGLSLDRQGRLLVSDSYAVPPSRIGPDGRVERFPEIAGGGDTEVGRDGRVYFSALPAWKRTGEVLVDFLLLVLEASAEGELRVFDPASRETRVLARGLLLPDGVALSRAEDFVAVGDFAAYRIVRHWLVGARAGSSDVLTDSLPGVPDGLAADGKGLFWVALAAPRNPTLDRLHGRPFLKDQLTKLLPLLLRASGPPAGGQPSFVLAIDEQGRTRRGFRIPRTLLGGPVSSAVRAGDSLWLASLSGSGLARCRLDGRPG